MITTRHGSSCTSEHEVVEAQTHSECSSCDFAWAMTLDAGDLDGDEDACSELEELSETTVVYGHSSNLLVEYGGIEYYELHVYDSQWAQEGDGYSVLDGNDWFFATK